MSGWRALVVELHSQGGGPLPSARFNVVGDGLPSALGRARDLGLLRRAGREPKGRRDYTWVLTRLGCDYVEGRCKLVERRPNGSAGPGRGRTRVVATWLAALPPRNSIRLAPEAVTWSYQ